MKSTNKIVVLALAFAAAPVFAAAPRPGTGGAPDVALRSLPLIVAENPVAMGFRTAAEASTATLAEPLPVYLLRLDRLKVYSAGQNPMTLLTDLATAVYPVRVGTETRSSMELTSINGVWEPRSFGDPATSKLVDDVRTSAALAWGIEVTAFFEVRALALNVTVLGFQGPRGLMFVPLGDDASLGFQKGVALAAAQALGALQSLALAHDGLAH